MDYFSKFLRPNNQPSTKPTTDHVHEFYESWDIIKETLSHPDERQLARGIKSTSVPTHLKSLVDSLVWESTRIEEGSTGACLEYLLKNDVLGTLVRLSETDRPSGIQAEVLRTIQNMVVLMDEQFLVHSAVHKAVLRLLRNCAGDDLQEQLDGRKIMGAASNAVRSQPSEYEEDLVNLLCILCSRIRTYRELLIIFFHDRHWYHSEPLFAVEEEDEEEEEDELQLMQETPAFERHDTSSSAAAHGERKPEYEFLLFNYLLRFVHREGQIGDFARAGLLFLMDVAMSPTEMRPNMSSGVAEERPDPINEAALALAEYILDGDFSEVLGAGLGAVYSLLPSKLAFHRKPSLHPVGGSGMVIGTVGHSGELPQERLEAEREKARANGVEDAESVDFKFRLDHFLKLLEFLQDALRKNKIRDSVDASALVGTAIGQSILDAVRRIFFENVLYPSILECSDADGSAVAVMSYVEIMLRTLSSGELGYLLIDFLLSEDNDEVAHSHRRPAVLTLGPSASRPNAQTKKGRRKSSAMMLLEMEAPESNRPTEYFTSMGRFTLKDLLLSNLRSSNHDAATSALQLFECILVIHPQLITERLLLVIPDPNATSYPRPPAKSETNRGNHTAPDNYADDDEDSDIFNYPGDSDISGNEPLFVQPETTYTTHEREMGLYLALVSRIDHSHNTDPFSTGYEHYLQDALLSIQSQAGYQLHDDDTESRKALKHRLNVNDPILSNLFEAFRKFFSNNPEFNMALTGVLATLAINPDRSLAGWLTLAPSEEGSKHDLTEDDFAGGDDGDDRSVDFIVNEQLSGDTNILPAASMEGSSRPVVHTILHGLVSQLERYRLAVDNFDKFLLERRQGLLFSENLTDALTISLELSEEPISTVPIPTLPQQPKPKAKMSATSSLVSFLTPKKSKTTTRAPASAEPSTPKKSEPKGITASPFGRHYHDTESIVVEPFAAPIPSWSPWTPSKKAKWEVEEEDVFSAGWGDRRPGVAEPDASASKTDRPTTVTLSHLLDNVVILEESIKELVAIIHARRSLGIDSVRYL